LVFQTKLGLIMVGEQSAQKKQELDEVLHSFVTQNLSYKLVFKTSDPVAIILSTSEEKRLIY
jgi:hypothetical protein